MFNPRHCGLYFSEVNIHQSRQYSKRTPFKEAWSVLHETSQSDSLAATYQNGLRYKFDNDQMAGEQAVASLGVFKPADEDAVYWDSLAETLVLAQCYEMLREHPAFAPKKQADWREAFSQQVTTFNQKPFEMSQAELLWLALLNVAAGIVLEREPLFEQGAAVFRQTIDEQVRPEGFIPGAVQAGDGQGLRNQLLSVQVLTLMAEAAHHVGIDLWSYNNRGVSVLTATTYPLYYYFYPEKWLWEGALDLEAAQQLFRQHGGFLEILNRRYDRPLRAIRLILKEIRPINDLYGGGLTTLTHGVPERRGLFG